MKPLDELYWIVTGVLSGFILIPIGHHILDELVDWLRAEGVKLP